MRECSLGLNEIDPEPGWQGTAGFLSHPGSSVLPGDQSPSPKAVVAGQPGGTNGGTSGLKWLLNSVALAWLCL